MTLPQRAENKKILFITTKNIDYIRNTQELKLIGEHADLLDVVFSKAPNNLFRIIHVWLQLCFKSIKKYDAVFVGFEPQFIVPFWSHKLRKKSLYIDFFISVYDTLISDRKKFSDKSIFSAFFRYLDTKTIDMADHIVVDTNAHRNFFIDEFTKNSLKDDCVFDKFETIYLEADPKIYYPREKNKRDDGRYTVLYFGSVLPLQGVDIVLDAMNIVGDRENIYFDIIGPISADYDKPVQKNINYINWLSQEDLANHIAQADLCLAGHFSGNIDKAWRTIPGKAYIYEAMNKKMILGDGAANHELFDADEKHIFVKMGDSKALAECIIEQSKSECL